jgi:hypothetical protein
VGGEAGGLVRPTDPPDARLTALAPKPPSGAMTAAANAPDNGPPDGIRPILKMFR